MYSDVRGRAKKHSRINPKKMIFRLEQVRALARVHVHARRPPESQPRVLSFGSWGMGWANLTLPGSPKYFLLEPAELFNKDY